MQKGMCKWLALSVFVSTMALAQQGGQLQTPPPPQIIKPKLTVGNLVFTLNIINGVEIQGREVDAYLEVRKALDEALQSAQKANRSANDEITLELQLPVAQNLMTLLQRARITGADAERFKQVTDAIVTAAQAATNTTTGQTGQGRR